MTVVSSKEFATNQDKYFELALSERVFIKKGNHLFFVTTANEDESEYDYEDLSDTKACVCDEISGVEFIKHSPRQGWAEAFKEFAASGAEEKFFPDFFEDEDLSWWTWDEEEKK